MIDTWPVEVSLRHPTYTELAQQHQIELLRLQLAAMQEYARRGDERNAQLAAANRRMAERLAQLAHVEQTCEALGC